MKGIAEAGVGSEAVGEEIRHRVIDHLHRTADVDLEAA
jgi:hypothetical protein